MAKNKRIPGAAGTGHPRKAVPAAARPGGFLNPPTGKLSVRWTKFDYDGPFCLGRSDIATVVNLFKQVSNLESMTWTEVFTGVNPRGTGYGEIARLPNAVAVNRLKELSLGDETNVSRLRFTGEQRLYGFCRDSDFYAIFWDPFHEIWPSKLKHT